MGVKLQDTLEKRGSGQFPLLNDNDLLGGFQVVATKSSSVPPVVNRKRGMYVYETDTGKTWQLTTLPDTWTEVEAGATAVKPSVLVYQPGGTAGGNVYTSWSSLFTAFQSTSGHTYIVIDASVAPTPGTAVIPAGTSGEVVQDFAGKASIIGAIYNGVPPILDNQGVSANHVVLKNVLRYNCVSLGSTTAEKGVKLYEFSLCDYEAAIGTTIDAQATLLETASGNNFHITATDTLVYLYGTVEGKAADAGTLYLSGTSASLRLYIQINGHVDNYAIATDGDAGIAYILLLSKSSYFSHKQCTDVVLDIDVGVAYDTVIIDEGFAYPSDNYFASWGTAQSSILSNWVKTILIKSDVSMVGTLGTGAIKRIIGDIRHTFTVASDSILTSVNLEIEGLDILFDTSSYSDITGILSLKDCSARVLTGKKGWIFTDIAPSTPKISLDGCLIGTGLGATVFQYVYDAGGTHEFTGKIGGASYCCADAFAKSGGTLTLALQKKDPGSGVDAPQTGGLDPTLIANVTYTGDIYGSDASTEVRKIYTQTIDSGAATPADLSVLIYDTDNTRYQSSPFLQDYMLATADPTIAINPATPLVEVGYTLEDPTFAIVYTPGPSVAPALSYDHLADGGEGHDDNILSDPESPTMSYHYGPKTYGQTVTWTVTCRRGIGPVERTNATTTTWVNKVYYGVSDVPATPAVYTQDFIKAFTSGGSPVLSNTAYRTITGLNPTGNNHIYYACRTSYGLTGDNFWIGGFQGGFTDKTQTVRASASATFEDGEEDDSITITVDATPYVIDTSEVTGGRSGYITALNTGLTGSGVTVYAYGGSEIIFANNVTGPAAPAVSISALGGDASEKLGVGTGAFNHKVFTTYDTAGTDYSIFESNQTGLGSCTVVIQ